jgi:curved DNA-binding protein CbpA
MEDFYAVLGVSVSADISLIEKAYKKKALLLHPDKNPGRDTTVEFQNLGNLYAQLKDPVKRRAYDALHRVRYPQSYATSNQNYASPKTSNSPFANIPTEKSDGPKYHPSQPFSRPAPSTSRGEPTGAGFKYNRPASSPKPAPPPPPARPELDIRSWKYGMHAGFKLRLAVWAQRLANHQQDVAKWRSLIREAQSTLGEYKNAVKQEISNEVSRLYSEYQQRGWNIPPPMAQVNALAKENVEKRLSPGEEHRLEENLSILLARLKASVDTLRTEAFELERTEYRFVQDATATMDKILSDHQKREWEHIHNFGGQLPHDLVNSSYSWYQLKSIKEPFIAHNRCASWDHDPRPIEMHMDNTKHERCGRCHGIATLAAQMCASCKTVLCEDCVITVKRLVKYYQWLAETRSNRFFVL